MDKFFVLNIIIQIGIVLAHVYNKVTAWHTFAMNFKKADTRQVLGTSYDEVSALIAFARSTFLNDSIVNVLFIIAVLAIDWHMLAYYLAFYVLVILPVFRYYFVKHRDCLLFKRIKPRITF